MSINVKQISEWINGIIIKGDENTIITGVNSIDNASSGDLVFVRDKKYEALLTKTQASAVLMSSEPVVPVPENLVCIIVTNPELAFLQVLQQFNPQKIQLPEGIHPSAVVGDDVTLGENIAIGPFVFVGNNSKIGNKTKIYPHVYIGENCEIGENTIIFPNVTIREETKIGSNCIIHSGVCIGTDGFGFIHDGNLWHKIPQIGCVIIGDNVEIGSNTCIDRATFGETQIGTGTKIDNLVQIGHNVKIGENCAIAATTGIAGSATIGNSVRIGAGAGINGHINIGDNATIGAWSGVAKSVEVGAVVSGFPATEHSRAKRILVAQQYVPELLRRVKELEMKIQEIESKVYEKSANNQ
ncbi:MAG: UDP-3-O-(3-hydroxymyristoyl)glucosamine N-acyltransferase [Candidatus Hydrogenedens sp.]|mgnify:CR=1 FL=1|nr:UDP-3-O-(3-hydroxymyristoyl)glucosamine N-acyltransferase [Candidatus Hydrogenedens sp.]